MSHRKDQIESLLQRAVAQVLQRGLADPRIKGIISVTEVDVSPDLRNATVSVSILPEQHEALTMHGLRDATLHIQRQVNKQLALRAVPHLTFEVDKGLKKQAELLAAISEGMRRTEANAQPADDETHAAADSAHAAAERGSASEAAGTDTIHPKQPSSPPEPGAK
jgi:ribosome-binding factor A